MPSTAINDEIHLKVLRALQTQPSISQRELASDLGISLGKANYCMQALIDMGLVKARRFRSSENKLAYAYLLTPAGISRKTELTLEFLRRKMSEFDALKREIEMLRSEIGRDGNDASSAR